MRHAARRDANEPSIVSALRHAGARVWRELPVDLLVAYRKAWHIIEVKLPKGGRLTEGQKELVALSDEGVIPPVHVVRTIEEALAVVRG